MDRLEQNVQAASLAVVDGHDHRVGVGTRVDGVAQGVPGRLVDASLDENGELGGEVLDRLLFDAGDVAHAAFLVAQAGRWRGLKSCQSLLTRQSWKH
ncbi:hypothetical protein D3C79_796690 [compost metagenome]